MSHVWSPQQSVALDDCATWLKDPWGAQVFRLFGYAGTGKTTLALHLAEHARFPIFAAFTGKAASVMRSKGCPNATTLHGLLYNVQERDRTRLAELELALKALDPAHPDFDELTADYDTEKDKCKRPWFYVNDESKLLHADLLVVDEVSMVDERIGKDILSFGKKLLVLGDPAQLPPVQGGGYFTAAKPNVLLTEIHRQAADNPILQWATLARKGEAIPYGDLGAARKVQREAVSDAFLAKSAGQLLCGMNRTRQDLNARVRAQLGRTTKLPTRGDVLVMLQNDHKLGVLNGEICSAYSDSIHEEGALYCTIKYPPEPGQKAARLLHSLRCDPAPFLGQEFAARNARMQQIDFGYALTVHKSQGSQWPMVTLYDDSFGKRDPEVRRRWLYTAITRAAETLVIVTS